MAQAHRFGGNWTNEKLKLLGEYLKAYTQIFTANERASFFTTTYVDAFAGTGSRSSSSAGPTEPSLFDHDAEGFQKGSARIALENEPPFDRFLFIERKADFARQLRELRELFPEKVDRIQVLHGEANRCLCDWASKTNWQQNRAVVFLDPYGMEVEWATIEALAKTRGVDLWILFPLGQAVNRLLTTTPPEGPWATKLTRFFGTEEWRQAFYKTPDQLGLFPTGDQLERDADYDAIGAFFLDRLRGIFAGVSPFTRPLRNSRGIPIYLLCFAAANEKGARPAINIANYLLKPQSPAE